MAVLVDANILIRVLDRQSHDFSACAAALRTAKTKRGEFFVCAQVMIEFWAVVTRPISANGLGLSTAHADTALDEFSQFLPILPEPSDIATRWRRIVRLYAVSGKPAHDARIAAIMETHSIKNLLHSTRVTSRDILSFVSFCQTI